MQKLFRIYAAAVLVAFAAILGAALPTAGAQTLRDAPRSAYDFDQLSGVIDADQVDYYSGNWSYALPLGEVEGAGGLSLPIRLLYSSAVTGTDRLIRLSADTTATSTFSKGTVTLNNAGWVGLGWNLEFGAIRVTGGHNLQDTTSPINHPFSFNLSLLLPDGAHRLVRQLDDSERAATPGTPLPATNVYYAENRRFMDVRWNFDRNAPLASTWTVRTVSGLIYTFGPVAMDATTYGMNLTVKGGAVLPGGFSEINPELVYQWNLAEIRDQAGNAIRFRYATDGPVTTVRDRSRERAPTTRSFRNLLDFADLDPRYPNGVEVGGSLVGLTVVKTFRTGHLTEVVFTNAGGGVVRRIKTVTSQRPDIHVASRKGVKITYDNYYKTHPGDLVTYGHHLLAEKKSYRMYDGLASAHRLDGLTVTDGAGSRIARYVFRYDDTSGGPARPSVASGDDTRTLLLEEVAVMGRTDNDRLPPYRFTNALAESYRVTKITTPTGGELTVGYEAVPPPDTTWTVHTNYDEGWFARTRRIGFSAWDADGAGGPAPPDTTRFVYVATDQVMDTVNRNKMRRITFPLVDEVLPGSHGKIRRDFTGEADLDALGLDARNRKHEAERATRRGLLESTTYYSESGKTVKKEETVWKVTAAGTWTGNWQWYYYPGIPQQAYWIRADTLSTTKDGVAATTVQAHNTRNGLVSRRTLKSGGQVLRVAETGYQADSLTVTPVTLAWQPPVLDTLASRGDYLVLTSPYSVVQASRDAAEATDSEGVYNFRSAAFPVSGHDVLRVAGVLGAEQLRGGDNMYANASVTIRWNPGGSYTAGSFLQSVHIGGGIVKPKRGAFDVLVTVPSGADSAFVDVRMEAGVYKPAQYVYRQIRVYARDVVVTGLAAEDADEIYLERAHILDRPRQVLVKDRNSKLLQATRYGYGRFNRGAIVKPDTTSTWLDKDNDGQADAGEWIDRVATGYDAHGNLTEARDARGTVSSTVIGYDGMRPLVTVADAPASEVTAAVFDDHPSWTALTAPGSPWRKIGAGTPLISRGVLVLDGATVQQSLPVYASGVFECVVKAGSASEQTAVVLADGQGTGTERIRWALAASGVFRARDGAAMKNAGGGYVAHRWHRLRIEWNAGKWWATVDGRRYPSSGSYAMASGGQIARVRLTNAATAGKAHFDDVRTFPASARPGPMTTYDPTTLDAAAVADENQRTVRYLRDGLGRVLQIRDGRGRGLAQIDRDFSRTTSAASVYRPARPNRQTDIAYPARDGHKDLSADGHRAITRGTGDRIEEGVSLATTGTYVVTKGKSVTLLASVRIRLTTGFQARHGSAFRATIDPAAGGDEVTGTGDLSYNQEKENKPSVKLGPSSVLETGRVSGLVTARADFYPVSTSSGKTVILAFEDGADHVRVVYENGAVKLERSMNGQTTASAFAPGYSRDWPWARVEMELLPTGIVNAWLYDHETTRFKGASKSVSVPANWMPEFKAMGASGNGYLADLYVGRAEVVTTFYDGLGRPIQSRTRAESHDIVTQTGYNRAGKPERLLGPAHQAPSIDYGELTASAAGSRITQTAYADDPLLRISRVIPPGHTAATAVDSRYGTWGAESGQGRSYRTVEDEEGVAATSVYDAYGRHHYAIADSAGTTAATRNNRTSFGYDALDRRVSSNMPGGGRSTYAYDTLGRMISRHHPDADGATRYKYDDLGRIRFSQDARQKAAGKVTYTVHDDFGRVTRVGEGTFTGAFASLDPDSTYAFERDSASWRSRMVYDDDHAAGEPNHVRGRLAKVEENTDADAAAEVTHLYAYDALGNVRVKRVEIEGLTGAKTVEYEHDLAGRVTRLIYPDGSQARYAYDGAGRLSRVRDAEGRTLAAYTHTAAGNVKTHVVGEGAGEGVATGTFRYNPREWVTGIDYPGRFTVTQQYDNVGNVTSQRYRRAAAETNKVAAYTYDNLHRLTGFNLDSGANTRSYVYDRNGNINSMVTGSNTLAFNYSSGSTPNRLDSTSGTGEEMFTYNPNGWMTGKGASTLTYDYRGLTTGHGSARYLMDPDRRRVKKTVGTAVTYYLRGADGSVLAEYSGQNLSARYVYAGTRRIASVASSASYYLADHLGSTRTLIDEAGAVTAAYDYWPYGKVLASSGTGSTHFRFTGHERDAESGLDYMLERSYAFNVGRFLRPDPMQDGYPGISPYAYANNNPLKYVDPNGAYIESFWDAINIGIGAASLAQNVSEGSYGWAALDVFGLAVDVTAVIVPGVPGGAGTLIKAIRGTRAINQVENATDVAKTIDAGRAASSGTGAKGSLRNRLGEKPPGMRNAQAHHDLPQAKEFQAHWKRVGLDINDPAYGRWVSGSPQGRHQNWSHAFNKSWREFFRINKNATREEILDHMYKLRKSGDYE